MRKVVQRRGEKTREGGGRDHVTVVKRGVVGVRKEKKKLQHGYRREGERRDCTGVSTYSCRSIVL